MSSVRWFVVAVILFAGGAAAAQEPPPAPAFAVAVTTPTAIEEYPGIDKTLKVMLTNTSRAPFQNLLLYMTMADVTRNLVVDLSDFNATKVFTIDTIAPRESINLDVPLKLVFTGDFYLYMTAIAKDTGTIAFSRAVSVKIYGAASPPRSLVVVVSVVVPGILLAVLLWLLFARSEFRIHGLKTGSIVRFGKSR